MAISNMKALFPYYIKKYGIQLLRWINMSGEVI